MEVMHEDDVDHVVAAAAALQQHDPRHPFVPPACKNILMDGEKNNTTSLDSAKT